MVVDAVSSEPLSGCISLLTGNLTGKSRGFGLSFTHGAACMLHNALCLARPDGPSKRKRNREFSRHIREFKFPVTGSSSENLLIFL